MTGYTWDQAVTKWLDEKSDKKDHRNDVQKAKFVCPKLTGKDLTEVTRDVVRDIVEVKQSPATRNRYVSFIRSVLRAAVDPWGWMPAAPKLKTYKEPKRRIKYLSREQAGRLISQLPAHQKNLFLFGLATGLRQGVVKGLQWDWVDFDQRVVIVPEEFNKGDELAVPLNEVAMAVITAQVGKHEQYVFTYNGKPVQNVHTRAWRKARKAADLVGFRWHDATRHTWASWLAQAGVNSLELQELGGWKSTQMVRRYAAMAPNHLRDKAAIIDGVLSRT